LLSRCSCVNVVSRQTERGTCVSGLLVMLNRVRWPYVWLLDSSESSCFDSSSRSTCVPLRKSTVSSLPPKILHLLLVGHDAAALLISDEVATEKAKTNKNTNLTHVLFILWTVALWRVSLYHTSIVYLYLEAAPFIIPCQASHGDWVWENLWNEKSIRKPSAFP